MSDGKISWPTAVKASARFDAFTIALYYLRSYPFEEAVARIEERKLAAEMTVQQYVAQEAKKRDTT